MAAPAFATARGSNPPLGACAPSRQHGHVPPELYPEILVHASVSTMARLALYGSVWNRAVLREAMGTKRQWVPIFTEDRSLYDKYPLHAMQGHLKEEKFTDFHKSVHLFGALFCRCDGPGRASG